MGVSIIDYCFTIYSPVLSHNWDISIYIFSQLQTLTSDNYWLHVNLFSLFYFICFETKNQSINFVEIKRNFHLSRCGFKQGLNAYSCARRLKQMKKTRCFRVLNCLWYPKEENLFSYFNGYHPRGIKYLVHLILMSLSQL